MAVISARPATLPRARSTAGMSARSASPGPITPAKRSGAARISGKAPPRRRRSRPMSGLLLGFAVDVFMQARIEDHGECDAGREEGTHRLLGWRAGERAELA